MRNIQIYGVFFCIGWILLSCDSPLQHQSLLHEYEDLELRSIDMYEIGLKSQYEKRSINGSHIEEISICEGPVSPYISIVSRNFLFRIHHEIPLCQLSITKKGKDIEFHMEDLTIASFHFSYEADLERFLSRIDDF